jgi:hypothetical protein
MKASRSLGDSLKASTTLLDQLKASTSLRDLLKPSRTLLDWPKVSQSQGDPLNLSTGLFDLLNLCNLFLIVLKKLYCQGSFGKFLEIDIPFRGGLISETFSNPLKGDYIIKKNRDFAISFFEMIFL